MYGIQESLIDLANNALRVDIISGGSGGGSVTVPNPIGVSGTVSIGNLPASQVITAADGAISTLGALADGAVGDASGSLNAHIRYLDKFATDVWDQVNHEIRTSATSTPNQGLGNAGTSPWSVSGSVSIAGGSLPVTQSTTPWAIAGQSASGAVANNINPVLMGGINPSNLLHNLQLDASDNLKVALAANPTVTQGTGNAAGSPWAVSGTVTVSNALTVTVPNPIGVSGGVTVNSGTVTGSVTTTYTTVVNTSLTRPNNSTTYSANTALANATSSAVAITFTNCARGSGGTGVILGAKLFDFTNQTTVLQAELWLYDTTPGTVISDNANWAPVSGDVQNLVGIIPFSLGFVGNNSGTAGTGNVIFEAYNLSLPFKCTSTANLFGQLVVRNAYVPVANELFIVRLDISQD